MQKYMRWSAIFTMLLLVLAACGGGSPSPSQPAASTAESMAASTAESMAPSEDPTATCNADQFGCVEVAQGDPIVLGTALAITGDNADLGLDSQYGAQVAVDLYGQVLGHDVQLDNQDDGCSAEGGTAAANLLKSKPEIAAVIGTSCSSAGQPAAQILSGAGILLVSPSNTAPALTDPATHQPFYARTAHNDTIQGAAMAKFANDVLAVTSAATINDGSVYADQLQQVFADGFTSDYGGTITDQEAITVGQKDFTSVLTSIASGSPELLYYPIFTAEGALITQQARTTAGMENTILAGADGLFSPTFLAAAGAAAEGMYLSGPDLNFSGSFYEETFLPEYTKVSGEAKPISVFHAHAFDAVNMVLDAIKKVAITGSDGTLYIPRTALKDAFLATSNYQGITGNLTCDANGDCADAKISVSQVENASQGNCAAGEDRCYVRIWP